MVRTIIGDTKREGQRKSKRKFVETKKRKKAGPSCGR